jgi:hypothetical protein
MSVTKPFIYNVKCSANESDFFQTELVEGENGGLVSMKVAYKRIRGFVPYSRVPTEPEIALHRDGKLPENMIMKSEQEIEIHTGPTIIEVPPEHVDILEAKGLAKRIDATVTEHAFTEQEPVAQPATELPVADTLPTTSASDALPTINNGGQLSG